MDGANRSEVTTLVVDKQPPMSEMEAQIEEVYHDKQDESQAELLDSQERFEQSVDKLKEYESNEETEDIIAT